MNSFLGYRYRIISQNELNEVVDLRKQSYQYVHGSNVLDSGLEWNKTDEQSSHLGLVDVNDNLVSCLRLKIYFSIEWLEYATLFETPKEIQLPVALLSRAATKKELLDLKLHSFLRLKAYESLIDKDINWILGTAEVSAKRFEQLLRLKYQVFSLKEKWEDSFYKNTDEVSLLGLSKNNLLDAISQLRADITSPAVSF